MARLLIEVRPTDLSLADEDGAVDAYRQTLPAHVRPNRETLLDWMVPAFDLALAGFTNWLGMADEAVDPRMLALQKRSFGFMETAINIVERLR